jgi:hypothetical protein
MSWNITFVVLFRKGINVIHHLIYISVWIIESTAVIVTVVMPLIEKGGYVAMDGIRTRGGSIALD